MTLVVIPLLAIRVYFVDVLRLTFSQLDCDPLAGVSAKSSVLPAVMSEIEYPFVVRNPSLLGRTAGTVIHATTVVSNFSE